MDTRRSLIGQCVCILHCCVSCGGLVPYHIVALGRLPTPRHTAGKCVQAPVPPSKSGPRLNRGAIARMPADATSTLLTKPTMARLSASSAERSVQSQDSCDCLARPSKFPPVRRRSSVCWVLSPNTHRASYECQVAGTNHTGGSRPQLSSELAVSGTKVAWTQRCPRRTLVNLWTLEDTARSASTDDVQAQELREDPLKAFAIQPSY